MSHVRAAREYLSSHHVLCLATTNGNQPWVSPVFYAGWRDSLVFLSAPHTRHAKNIDTNPLVSASVQEDYKEWELIKGLQIEGVAERIVGKDRSDAIACYASKFPVTGKHAPPQIAKALDKVGWYRMQPTLVHFIDNSKGLGFRETVDPKQLF